MTAFEFATASRIIFGNGTVNQVPLHAKDLGKRPFLVTGKDKMRSAFLEDLLMEAGLEVNSFSVPGEPTIQLASQGAESARNKGCDSVIGIGGGSVLDTAKAISGLATNKEDIYDYLEIIGKGLPLTENPLPCIAIPTTAGTGAEVTSNSVLKSEEYGIKVSLRNPLLLPDLAVIDPRLTYGLPPQITASTGLDALTQLIEAFVSNKANPMTDALCREGIFRSSRSLLKVYRNGSDQKAREDMALASLFGGLALANAKLGAVHGFAGPIGGMIPAPHGVICGRLLPLVMEKNIKALQKIRQTKALSKFKEVAGIVTGDSNAPVEKCVLWIKNLCQRLKLPSLSNFGLKKSHFPELVRRAKDSSSMKGNPVELADDMLLRILEESM